MIKWKKSNCLIFVIGRLISNRGQGYIIIRKSNFGWWPHFMYAKSLEDAQIEHYVPAEPLELKSNTKFKKLIFKFLPLHILLFEGVIKTREHKYASNKSR